MNRYEMASNIQRLTGLVYLSLSTAALVCLTTFLLLVPACTTVPANLAEHSDQILKVRGVIIVDAQGRERITIGAPWPALAGRESNAQGVGMLIVDSIGVDRVNVASPAPDPPGFGKRIAPANGLTFYDQQGNERGGVGYLDNGRSLLVLDNEGGEGAGVFSFDNGYVGMGLLRQGHFRALTEFNPETQAVSVVLSDSLGRPRIRLAVSASGAASLHLLDENGNILGDP